MYSDLKKEILPMALEIILHSRFYRNAPAKLKFI